MGDSSGLRSPFTYVPSINHLKREDVFVLRLAALSPNARSTPHLLHSLRCAT